VTWQWWTRHRTSEVAAFWEWSRRRILASLIVIGSRNLDHFDAALVGYTFATLFATFGITYRCAMWLSVRRRGCGTAAGRCS
jgi:hypothetical protein